MSEAATEPRPGVERAFVCGAAGLSLWLLLWVWISWPYMLDDALIHLRYADHLLHQHMISYDGVHASFGTSSLLYVTLLAGLRAFWASPLLPRVVSSVVYVVLFGALCLTVYRGLRGRRQVPDAVWLIGFGVLAVMVAPSAVRWLDDGMETGLVFLDVLVGVLLVRGMRSAQSGWMGLGAFVYGLLTVLLRVELLSLVGCMALMAGLKARAGNKTRGRAQFVPSLLLVLGGLAGAGLILVTMHVLLPDTAIAKAFGGRLWRETFQMTAVTLGSSFSFGIGLLLLWLGSLWAMVYRDGARAVDLLPNLLFPGLLLAAATRGQQIQGIRYFGWTVFFPLLWNLLRLAESPWQDGQRPPLGLTPLLILFLVVLVPSFAWESRVFARVFGRREAALRQFRAEPFNGLRGQKGIAEDVGFVGYFTQGDICDPYGLVNGRAAAHLNYDQRFARCMAGHPVFAFGSREFMQKVTHVQPLVGWLVCGVYPLENVRSPDLHYLVVAPSVVSSACSVHREPIARTLPGLL